MLRRAFPKAHIRWLVNPEWAPLLDGNPYLDEVVLFPRGQFRGLAGWSKIPRWAKAVALKKAELVLDFQGLLRSALIARLCRAPGGRILGLSDAREGASFFYDEIADVSGLDHAVDRYVALADLGIDKFDLPRGAPDDRLEWPLPEGSAPASFDDAPPFILLHPFARGHGKSLGTDDVARFCRTLAPHQIVIAGRSDDAVLPAENVLDLLNRTTLTELIWLIRRAAFVVSVDSGPMHIAAATTSRLVSIHTWSDPAKVGPYRPEAWVWKQGHLFQMRDLAVSGAQRACEDVTALAAFVRESL